MVIPIITFLLFLFVYVLAIVLLVSGVLLTLHDPRNSRERSSKQLFDEENGSAESTQEQFGDYNLMISV
jgi:hypothetical protein